MLNGKLDCLLGNVSKVANLETSYRVKWDFASDQYVCINHNPRSEVFFLDRGYPWPMNRFPDPNPETGRENMINIP